MKTPPARLLGVLVAMLLVAAGCGNSATTNAASDVANQAAETEQSTTDEDSMEDEAMEDEAMEDAEHGDDVDHVDGHDHDAGLEVDAALPIPAVEIALTETDVAGTFLIDVSLENFTITEENLDADPVDNEGHMHLYVDGERIERFFDIQHEVVVSAGEHLVEVELSANNHSALTLDGEPIRASATVTGSGEPQAEQTPEVSDAAAARTATYANGQVSLDGDERIEVTSGDVVMLTISSDVEEEIHVHGIDIFADVAPGEDAVVVFTADVQGRFEIEFEQSGQFIAELVIS